MELIMNSGHHDSRSMMQQTVMHQQVAADHLKIWFQRIKVPPYVGIVTRFSVGSYVMGSETPIADLTSPFFPLKPSQTVSVSHIGKVCSLPVENSDR